MYEYRGYNPKNNKHVKKYNATHYKQVTVAFDLDYYSSTLQPFCESIGLPLSTFIKETVKKEIERRINEEK